MRDDDIERERPIECRDCDESVTLVESPYTVDYILVCGCSERSIDVSDCCNGQALLEPLSGMWYSLDDEDPPGR